LLEQKTKQSLVVMTNIKHWRY